MSANLNFMPLGRQRTILEDLLTQASADDEIIGVLLAGSFARGDAVPSSDLDVYMLLRDGCTRAFQTDMRAGILVECAYADVARAQAKLAQNPMALYTYLDGRILYDPLGRLQQLVDLAHQLFATYSVPAHERHAIAHWLTSACVKIAAAQEAGNDLTAAYVVTTTAFEVLVGLWALNQQPIPPSGGVLAHLPDLARQPNHISSWLPRLFQGDTTDRIAVFQEVSAWLVPLLKRT